MTTYSVRCKHKPCRHRRVIDRHPDAYIRPPACPACGQRKGWRIENREYNRRGLCRCSGVDLCDGRNFPHRTTHPLCDNHPHGHRNQALRCGVPAEDLPIELMGAPCTTAEAPF